MSGRPLSLTLAGVLVAAGLFVGAPPAAAAGFPDATTTGVPPGTVLTPVEGDLTVWEDDPAVIDGQDINGCVAVRRNNVTIKRTRIRCDSWYPVRLHDEYTGLLLEDVEIDGMGSEDGTAIAFENYTARRVHVHDVGDGPRVGDNTVIEDSYIHDLVYCDGCHNDGIQSTGGSTGIRIRHNRIENPHEQTSCILLGDEEGPMDDAIIEDNLLNGGNYTIYVGVGTADPNVVVRNNRFGRDYVYGVLSASPDARVQWTDNVWHDTGEPVLP